MTRLTGHHTNLVMYRCLGPDETPEFATDRALTPPPDEGIEDDLITTCHARFISSIRPPLIMSQVLTIRILLPTCQFINDSERYTLLESTFRVRSPTKSITL